MGTRVLHASDATNDELRKGIEQIQQELHITPDFPPDVVAAAEAAVAAPRMPETDRTHLEFVTIDPVGSMDLDQAMHLAREGDGYVVHYAIADLPAFITAGDPIDLEAHRRGEALYGADSKIPLHPTELSEGAASLLPEQVCPAYVWTITLDAGGNVTKAHVERARVRSRARYDYEHVQQQFDAGTPPEPIALLKDIGELRIALEAERGGVSLPMPEQEIKIDGDTWTLEFRTLLPSENWNAQISLLTGFAAAAMMIEGKVGILRTLPPPEQHSVDRLRRTAKALEIDWPGAMDYPEFIRGLDANVPREAAMIVACTALLRGAGYADFNGTVPEQPEHSALASTYAHVTAPLRRLVDRFGLEICAALCAQEPVPQWVLDALPDLPRTMQESGRQGNAFENAILNLVEAATLKNQVGQKFDGVILELQRPRNGDDQDATKGTVMIREPAIEAPVGSSKPLPVGEQVTVTLVEADPATRVVRFEV